MFARRHKLSIAAAALAAAGVIAYALLSGHLVDGTGSHQPIQVAAARPVAPVVQPAVYVAPAAPTQFEIKGPAFDVKAHVCEMPYVRPLDPPGEQHHTVCWVDADFGVAPGSNAKGTSYLLGHSWAEDASEVLNPLSIYVMDHVDMNKPVTISGVPTFPASDLAGYTISLRTAHGLLTYAVHDAYAVSKDQAGFVAPLMDTKTPNRVVLITCGVHDGQDIDVNIIVDAFLVKATSAR